MSQSVAELTRANLLEVFGEHDPDRRAEVIARIFTEDVVFSDPDEVVVGRDALGAKAQRLTEIGPGFEFTQAGPIYENHDLGYVAWNFGPEGKPPVVQGIDLCFVEGGRIAKLYTIITHRGGVAVDG